jgi:DNA-binding NarL/FixJ family response regulator
MAAMTRPVWDRCTEDQRQVLTLLAKHGWKNERIAAELGIAPVAVRNHLRAMCAKLNLKGRIALVVAYLAECQEEKEPA